MKKIIGNIFIVWVISVLTIPSLNASLSDFIKRGSRDLSVFEGDELVIGCGKIAGHRKIDINKEYSIDIDRHVHPCIMGNGLDVATYSDMPDNRFAKITFYHIGLAPLYFQKFYNEYGFNDLRLKRYKESNWLALSEKESAFPSQLFRVLKPGGVLRFTTPIVGDLRDLKQTHLLNDKPENIYPLTEDLHDIYQLDDGFNEIYLLTDVLPLGLQVWEEHYIKAGFEDISFLLKTCGIQGEGERFELYYIQMTATKPLEEKTL